MSDTAYSRLIPHLKVTVTKHGFLVVEAGQGEGAAFLIKLDPPESSSPLRASRPLFLKAAQVAEWEKLYVLAISAEKWKLGCFAAGVIVCVFVMLAWQSYLMPIAPTLSREDMAYYGSWMAFSAAVPFLFGLLFMGVFHWRGHCAQKRMRQILDEQGYITTHPLQVGVLGGPILHWTAVPEPDVG